jgi:hypothetical protein
MRSTLHQAVLGAALLGGALCVWPSMADAVTLFDQTLTTVPPAVVNPDVGSFTNCLAAEGCMGHVGLVDTVGGNLPDTLSFTFTLTPAQVTALTSTPGESGALTVVASRDIGHKAGAAATDFIDVMGEGVALGSLFTATIDSCPAGERGTDYASGLVCGPNFHTDVDATDMLSLSSADLMSFAADGSITFVFDPTATVGRLKIFSVQLQVTQAPAIPEPATAGLVGLGLLAVALSARRKAASSDEAPRQRRS